MKIIQRITVPQSYSFNSTLTISRNNDQRWLTKSLSGLGIQYSEATTWFMYRAIAWKNSQCHSLTYKEYYHENMQF